LRDTAQLHAAQAGDGDAFSRRQGGGIGVFAPGFSAPGFSAASAAARKGVATKSAPSAAPATAMCETVVLICMIPPNTVLCSGLVVREHFRS
jgi:hypothetical protein